LFIDEETDTHKLVKKHEHRPSGFLDSSFKFISKQIGFENSRINQIDQDCKKYVNDKSDPEFVQELMNSTLFGEFKQNVLTYFFHEYQIWRNETFLNNIKEIVPKVSFNQQLNDRFNEELSQEKKDIENREFERICSELEKKYCDG